MSMVSSLSREWSNQAEAEGIEVPEDSFAASRRRKPQHPSCPALCRASTSFLMGPSSKTWMAGSSPAMTKWAHYTCPDSQWPACFPAPLAPNRDREIGGGRATRQPGQVRKEAALTRSGSGRSSVSYLFFRANRASHAASPPVALDLAPFRKARPERHSIADRPMTDAGAPPEDHTEQSGFDLGGLADAAKPYRVLARKYRPSSFNDLIGQEAMVRTVSNAFETGRIPQAWILTGVRGVGKTTTARILARALNYELADGSVKGPTIDLPVFGLHCQAIMESRHLDVIEMDAASHNGVDDVRQINDAIRYAPVNARYKVYILDEVHMLSTQAFNALLKTLEEPPPHAKFIFATTEIRKVPITILSRCQRFDLRRVDAGVLVTHLGNIAGKENIEAETEALALIARAAEGSVRDSLSLFDQA